MRALRSVPMLFAANASSAAMGFVILALLTRLLQPEDFGVFASMLNMMDVVVLVVDMLLAIGLVQVIAQNAVDRPERARMASKMALLVRLCALVVLVGACLVFAEALSRMAFGTPAHASDIRLIAIAVPLLSMATFVGNLLQGGQQFKRLAMLTLSKNGVRLACLGCVAALGLLTPTSAVMAVVVAAFGTAAIALAVANLRFVREPGFDRGVLREMMAVNKWIAVGALGFLGPRIDMAMLTSLNAPVQTGFYSVAYQLSMAITMLSTALATSLLPGAMQMTDGTAMRQHLVRCLRLLPLAAVAAVLAWPLLDLAVPLLFGAAYAPASLPSQLLAVSALLSLATNPILMLVFPLAMLPAYGLSILGQLAVRVPLNWILIPEYGAAGAAVSDLVAKAVTVVLLIGLILLKLRAGRATPAGQGSP